jgi:hypothetical protein
MLLDDINDVREWAEKMTDAVDSAFRRNTLSKAVAKALREAEYKVLALTNTLDNEPAEIICDAFGCREMVAESEAHKCDCGNKVCDLHWESEMCSDCREAGEEIPPDSGVDEEIRAINREIAAERRL